MTVAVAAPVVMLEPASSTPVVDAVEVETVLQDAECYWLHGALSLSEQITLFEFIKDHDRTDWDNLPVCMNPTPKTLQFADGADGGATTPTLTFNCGTGTETFASEAVCRVARILHRRSLLLASQPPPEPVSFSLAAIRYPSPDGRFPRHVDHCNDGSVVFLFSLGCHARFRVEARTTEGSSSLELELRSGDVLAFNPSTRAAITHAVAGIGGEESCPDALGERFNELRKFRYGIQCRVHF